MKSGACLNVNGTFANSTSGGIVVVGNDPVAFSFQGTAYLNQPLTSSPNLLVCLHPGSTVWGSWGNATVYDNCTGGCGILPYAKLLVEKSPEITCSFTGSGAVILLK
ncbi:MAG: hypothetical protein NZ989_03185 [Bacteroidia bacterium]|nr:hypothetical protein [Bacteroidia bacterium]MDW8057271.1 hypothetical protein [Bacteroidia bacterium]